MAQKTDLDSDVAEGRIKWFDSAKGFGFITCDNISGDVLLHANVLRSFGQSSVSDGSLVRVRVVETARGFQATELIHLEAPEIDPSDDDHHVPFDHSLEGGPLQPARVKWFDRAKGFGFANVFGGSEDVFIHIEVLRRSALADLQPGEAVAIRVAEGDRGRLATQVSVWESAYSDDTSSEPSSD